MRYVVVSWVVGGVEDAEGGNLKEVRFMIIFLIELNIGGGVSKGKKRCDYVIVVCVRLGRGKG